MHLRSARFLWTLVLAASVAAVAAVAAAESPRGAETATDLYSARFTGGGAFTTSTGSAQADAVNPAASGEEQRIVLDAGYAALAGLGSESGTGHAVNLGGVLPTKYAVFAGSLRLLTSPFDAYPLGTAFGLKASAAKELYPGFSAGVGLGGSVGDEWSLGMDLGVRHRLGDVSFMKDFAWAAVLGGLGKGWAPSAFTPSAGAAFKLIKEDRFTLGLAADLGAPSFATLAGKFGVEAGIDRFAVIGSSIGFNLKESIDGKGASPIPSFSLTLNFTLAGPADPAKRSLFSDGEAAVTLAAKPLYGDVWAFGAGAVAVLGVVDKTPPAISVDYPKPVWISPNNDGKADVLEFPVSITDGRYVLGWSFIIENEKGEAVRIFRNKERRPENEGFRDLVARVMDVKSGVEIPRTLRWDGIGDSGALAPDGRYLFRVEAVDDNGNAAASPRYEVYIDTTPPAIAVAQPEQGSLRIFSPDGDGSKDVFPIAQKGSVEDSWKAAVVDSSGTALRSFPLENAAPGDFEWDGKDDAGRVVPDGVYRYEIGAVDRALNEGRASLDNIIVNTERPPVNVMIDEAYFSPNGDGVKDALTFSPGVPIKEGLVAWTIEVQDRAGNARRTFRGASDVPAKVAFDGKTDDGRPAAEGAYQGVFVARYQNGYEAKSNSPVFTIDVTAPAVNVLRPGVESQRTFSPDGDGSKDVYVIAQGGSREDLWTSRITDAAGKVVRTKSWEAVEPTDFVWDGTDDAGRLVPDGSYLYEIASRDRAGNAASATSAGIIVDTTKPSISVAISTGFFSPNDDGVMDEVILSLGAQNSPSAESWSLELMDGANVPRRSVRGSGAPDDKVAFGGLDDQRKALPEGAYRARLSVSYKNGYNAATTSPTFVLDLTPPAATVRAEIPGFSPNGDGNLDQMAFSQSGGDEVAWRGEITQDGKAVRTFSFAGVPPAKLEWDGLDAEGKLAPDGSYDYRLSAVDRAGNRGASNRVSFALSTANTPLLVVADQRAFSPNGDGVKDTIVITPQPQVKEGIESWRMEVLDASGAVVRAFEGTGIPAAQTWNGRDARGSAVKDGAYSARAEVRYTLGNRPVASSTPFVVDTVAPAIELAVPAVAFSPNGDGSLDELRVSRTTPAGDDEWTLAVLAADAPAGAPPVRAWTWKGAAGDFSWNGEDDAGNVVPDGRYALVAEARDAAGNYRRAAAEGIVVDTVAPAIELAAPAPAFSPNGDGRLDTLAIAQKTAGDDAWEGAVVAADNSVVRTWTWKGPAQNIVWNGRNAAGAAAPDGTYRYVAKSTDAAGNRTERTLDGLILDTAAPAIDLSFPYTLFSPNGDGRKDELVPSIRTSGNDEWEAAVVAKSGAVLAAWKWKGAAAAGPAAVSWNGRDAAGNVVPDGTYRFTAKSEDAAGNRTERNVDGIAVDNRPTRVFATSSAQGVSPNGDGAFDTLRFGLVVTLKEGIEDWKVDIADETGRIRRSIGPDEAAGAKRDEVPDAVVWDGKDTDGVARDGKLTARLSVFYRKGDLASAAAGPFVVDITPPALSLDSRPRWFSPDNDGVEDDLSINLSARDASALASWSLEIREPQPPAAVFFKAEGVGSPTPRIIWDGRSQKGELVQAATDYPAVLAAVDAWGNTARAEAIIGVDVLVIREGDVLKIKVPSIIFRENEADFLGLPQDTVDNNLRVLRRIAQILNKFKDYKVKVEGHANPVLRTPAEERNELQPLSEKRAKAVLDKLVEFGVDAPRLSSVGMGGTRPVVKWEDRADWWKNRRVEFILVK